MDTNRGKKAAEWYYANVFRDEAIRPRYQEPPQRLPSALRAARSLENGMDGRWQSRESVFLKQARLLASYEDDFVYNKPVCRYYPTYQSLTDEELRGYFSWRTKLRRGNVEKTSLSYAFLYIYELLNQIGVENPMEGYEKLKAFGETFGTLDTGILPYLRRWLFDYVVYYDLDPALLADTPRARFDSAIGVLADIGIRKPEEVWDAVTILSSYAPERSRFCKTHREDFSLVLTAVLRRIGEHYDARCKKTMVEQYFGTCTTASTVLFEAAVFCDPMKVRSREYDATEVRTYRCENGFWYVRKYICPERPSAKLGDLVKAVDSVMRECFDYGHPIQRKLDTKWILKIIQEETQSLLEEKKQAEARKVTIDLGKLGKIRRDAVVTRDALLVEEEIEIPEPQVEVPAPPPEPSGDTPLSREEYRLLHDLLYGGDYGWVVSSGLMLSVLVDGINEKLYDTFADSVLDDTPELIEDYIEDLKEMVRP